MAAAVEEGKKHDVSKRTIQRASAKMRGATRKSSPKKKKVGVSHTPPTNGATPLGLPKGTTPPPPTTSAPPADYLSHACTVASAVAGITETLEELEGAGHTVAMVDQALTLAAADYRGSRLTATGAVGQ